MLRYLATPFVSGVRLFSCRPLATVAGCRVVVGTRTCQNCFARMLAVAVVRGVRKSVVVHYDNDDCMHMVVRNILVVVAAASAMTGLARASSIVRTCLVDIYICDTCQISIRQRPEEYRSFPQCMCLFY